MVESGGYLTLNQQVESIMLALGHFPKESWKKSLPCIHLFVILNKSPQEKAFESKRGQGTVEIAVVKRY
jgi:hypothetical protein